VVSEEVENEFEDFEIGLGTLNWFIEVERSYYESNCSSKKFSVRGWDWNALSERLVTILPKPN